MKLYGLKTCDTCKKAMKALGAELRDVRAEPLSPPEWQRFLDAFGDRLVNRASTTWRQLDPAERLRPPLQLLAAHPTLMKRPVIERDGELFLGWDEDVRAKLLG
jgi:arsenate reductase